MALGAEKVVGWIREKGTVAAGGGIYAGGELINYRCRGLTREPFCISDGDERLRLTRPRKYGAKYTVFRVWLNTTGQIKRDQLLLSITVRECTSS